MRNLEDLINLSDASILSLYDGLLYDTTLDDAYVTALEAQVRQRDLDKDDPRIVAARTFDGALDPIELQELLTECTSVRGIHFLSGSVREDGRSLRGRCLCPQCGNEAQISSCFDVGGAWVVCPICGRIDLL